MVLARNDRNGVSETALGVVVLAIAWWWFVAG
jgi:hypothetical protein